MNALKKLQRNWLEAIFSVLMGVILTFLCIPALGIIIWRMNVARLEVLGLPPIVPPTSLVVGMMTTVFVLTVYISAKNNFREPK